jgi:hypothetical protein
VVHLRRREAAEYQDGFFRIDLQESDANYQIGFPQFVYSPKIRFQTTFQGLGFPQSKHLKDRQFAILLRHSSAPISSYFREIRFDFL